MKEGRGNNYQRDPGSQTYLPESRDDGSERWTRLVVVAGTEDDERDAERIGTDRCTERSAELKLPFAVRYIKLVVECFESYHSHFDEVGPQNRSSGSRARVPSIALSARLINNHPRRTSKCRKRWLGRCLYDATWSSRASSSSLWMEALRRSRALGRQTRRPFFSAHFPRPRTEGSRASRTKTGTRSNRQIGCGVLLSTFHITAIFDELDRRFLRRRPFWLQPGDQPRGGKQERRESEEERACSAHKVAVIC